MSEVIFAEWSDRVVSDDFIVIFAEWSNRLVSEVNFVEWSNLPLWSGLIYRLGGAASERGLLSSVSRNIVIFH